MGNETSAVQPNPAVHLLSLLEDGGIHSISEIAERLGVDSELVRALTEQLAHGGYLAPVSAELTQECGHCQVRSGCAGPCGDGANGGMMALTAKGARSITRRRAVS